MANVLLKTLKTGDAFTYKYQDYLALGLTPSNFSLVFCLNVYTHELEQFSDNVIVDQWESSWHIMEIHKQEGEPVRGKDLKRLV